MFGLCCVSDGRYLEHPAYSDKPVSTNLVRHDKKLLYKTRFHSREPSPTTRISITSLVAAELIIFFFSLFYISSSGRLCSRYVRTANFFIRFYMKICMISHSSYRITNQTLFFIFFNRYAYQPSGSKAVLGWLWDGVSW